MRYTKSTITKFHINSQTLVTKKFEFILKFISRKRAELIQELISITNLLYQAYIIVPWLVLRFRQQVLR